MTPEVQLVLINAFGLALAYGWIYPRLQPRSLGKIVIADLAVTALILAIAAYLHAEMGTRFWFFGFNLGPIAFSLIVLIVMEVPLFFWFANKHKLLP